MIRKIIFLQLISFLFALFPMAAFSHDKPINVLTWWGYLDDKKIINSVEKTCGVKISYDNYYSNDEFIRRWEDKNNSYDVIIFSQTIYNVIHDKIPKLNDSELYQQSASYNNVIKQHYVASRYPKNVVYFIHALTGFLWNPDSIHLTESDTIDEIFKKANDKYVIIIDDPVEASLLINANHHIKPSLLNRDAFNGLVKNSIVYISNDYSRLYEKNNFAFSFAWSGEAFTDLLAANKKLKFLIHPKLSYVSSDLLAQVSGSRQAACVSRELTSKTTMTEFQNYGYYFSPYADYSSITNPEFKKMYVNFVKNLPALKWIESVDQKTFDTMSKEWQLIKIAYSKMPQQKNAV